MIYNKDEKIMKIELQMCKFNTGDSNGNVYLALNMHNGNTNHMLSI